MWIHSNLRHRMLRKTSRKLDLVLEYGQACLVRLSRAAPSGRHLVCPGIQPGVVDRGNN